MDSRKLSNKILLSLLAFLFLTGFFQLQPARANHPGQTGGSGFWKILKLADSFLGSPLQKASDLSDVIFGEKGGFLEEIGRDVFTKAVGEFGETLRDNLSKKYLNKLLAKIQDRVAPNYGDIEADALNQGLEGFTERLLGVNFCNPVTAKIAIDISQLRPDFYDVTKSQCAFNEKLDNFKDIFAPQEEASRTRGRVPIEGERKLKGWDGWLELKSPRQNPYAFYFLTLEARSQSQLKQAQQLNDQLRDGLGFLADERIYRWHFEENVREGDKLVSKTVPKIQCPSKCSVENDSCSCSGIGLSLKEFEDWKKGPDFKPSTCQPVGQRAAPKIPDNFLGSDFELFKDLRAKGLPIDCRLVIDRQEIVTPGSFFGNLAAKAIYGDASDTINQRSDSFIAQALTKVVNSVIFRVVDEGLTSFGLKDKDEEQKQDFKLTSREDLLRSITDKSAWQELKLAYDKTLLDIDDKILIQDRLINILVSPRNNKKRSGVIEELNTALGCANKTCLSREKRFCERLTFGKDVPNTVHFPTEAEMSLFELSKLDPKVNIKADPPDDLNQKTCYNFEKNNCTNKCENIEVIKGSRIFLNNLCNAGVPAGFLPESLPTKKEACDMLEQCQAVQCHNNAVRLCSEGNIASCKERAEAFCRSQNVGADEKALSKLNPQIRDLKKEIIEIQNFQNQTSRNDKIEKFTYDQLRFGKAGRHYYSFQTKSTKEAEVIFNEFEDTETHLRWTNKYLLCVLAGDVEYQPVAYNNTAINIDFSTCSLANSEKDSSNKDIEDRLKFSFNDWDRRVSKLITITKKDGEASLDLFPWEDALEKAISQRETFISEQVVNLNNDFLIKTRGNIHDWFNLNLVIPGVNRGYDNLEELALNIENKKLEKASLLLSFEKSPEAVIKEKEELREVILNKLLILLQNKQATLQDTPENIIKGLRDTPEVSGLSKKRDPDYDEFQANAIILKQINSDLKFFKNEQVKIKTIESNLAKLETIFNVWSRELLRLMSEAELVDFQETQDELKFAQDITDGEKLDQKKKEAENTKKEICSLDDIDDVKKDEDK